MRKKLRKGVAALVSKVRKVKFDKGQHIQCANCLKGSYVGYYAAAYGLTMAEAEELEKIWRAVFRMWCSRFIRARQRRTSTGAGSTWWPIRCTGGT